MTKLIDSLCGVGSPTKRNRVQDSYGDVAPEKGAIAVDYDVLDVEKKGYYWPNGEPYRSSIVKVNEPGVALTSRWSSGNPRDLRFIPASVAKIYEIDDPKVTPGYYYLNAETNTIDRIGSTEEDLNKWMRSLDTDETIEAQKRDFARKEQLRRDERRMSAETSRENVEDSTSKVSDAAYNPKFEKLRRVLSDTTIVEELSHYMSSDELEEFTETLTRNYDIDLEEVEDSAK